MTDLHSEINVGDEPGIDTLLEEGHVLADVVLMLKPVLVADSFDNGTTYQHPTSPSCGNGSQPRIPLEVFPGVNLPATLLVFDSALIDAGPEWGLPLGIEGADQVLSGVEQFQQSIRSKDVIIVPELNPLQSLIDPLYAIAGRTRTPLVGMETRFAAKESLLNNRVSVVGCVIADPGKDPGPRGNIQSGEANGKRVVPGNLPTNKAHSPGGMVRLNVNQKVRTFLEEWRQTLARSASGPWTRKPGVGT